MPRSSAGMAETPLSRSVVISMQSRYGALLMMFKTFLSPPADAAVPMSAPILRQNDEVRTCALFLSLPLLCAPMILMISEIGVSAAIEIFSEYGVALKRQMYW